MKADIFLFTYKRLFAVCYNRTKIVIKENISFSSV